MNIMVILTTFKMNIQEFLMMLEVRVILFVTFLYIVSIQTSDSLNDDTYKYMSILSKYESFRGDIRKSNTNIKKCIPLKLWIFHRHGTRYPQSHEIKNMRTLLNLRNFVVENHKNGKGTLKKEDLNRLKEWKFDESMEAIPMFLNNEGIIETQKTAKRFKEKFPSLLDRKYSRKAFHFQHSDTQRTLKTAHAFIDGLFGENAHKNIEIKVNPLRNDALLFPFGGACKSLSEIFKSGNLRAITQQFENTDDYLNALKEVSTRLGFENTLGTLNLTTLFNSCAYDSAFNRENELIGAWCPALSYNAVKVVEYWWDLFMYSISGYGNPVKEKVACNAPKDLWERFATAVGELQLPNKTEDVVAYFSHDAVIMEIHSNLGLLKDDPPLEPTNYSKQQKRLWRLSEIVPFGSNIAAILQQCKSLPSGTKYQVSLFRNERPWNDFKQCPNGVCSWDNFKAIFRPVAESCKYEDFC